MSHKNEEIVCKFRKSKQKPLRLRVTEVYNGIACEPYSELYFAEATKKPDMNREMFLEKNR